MLYVADYGIFLLFTVSFISVDCSFLSLKKVIVLTWAIFVKNSNDLRAPSVKLWGPDYDMTMKNL